MLNSRISDWGSLRESSHKLIQEFLCTDLKVKWIAAIFDTDIKQLPRVSNNISNQALPVRTVKASNETFGLRLLIWLTTAIAASRGLLNREIELPLIYANCVLIR